MREDATSHQCENILNIGMSLLGLKPHSWNDGGYYKVLLLCARSNFSNKIKRTLMVCQQ